MIKTNEYCNVKIITDCNSNVFEDIFEESRLTKEDLRNIYYDLKNTSNVILTDERMTAVSNYRLLSISIIDDNTFWRDFV